MFYMLKSFSTMVVEAPVKEVLEAIKQGRTFLILSKTSSCQDCGAKDIE